jgi:hypothetical protein
MLAVSMLLRNRCESALARRGLELGASGSSGPLEWAASYSYIQATYQSSACIVSENNSTRGSSPRCSPQDPGDPGVCWATTLSP